jgi:hypothetical protein
MPQLEARSAPRSSVTFSAGDFVLVIALAITVGLWIYTRSPAASTDEDHLHPPAAHGGVIISLAGDRYHAEALVEREGILRLLMLGPAATEVIDVESQELVAYVNSGEADVSKISLSAEPQPGDRAGRTSQFVGRLPAEFSNKPLNVTIAAIRIGGQRYRLGFAWPPELHEPAMPLKVQDDAERRLYLEPGGIYTVADIAANGGLTASQKFAGFKAKHDFNPRPGDLLCPITQTKANPECSWIIASREYTFCCPPCIDEFLELAKQAPEQIKPPEAYVKQ